MGLATPDVASHMEQALSRRRLHCVDYTAPPSMASVSPYTTFLVSSQPGEEETRSMNGRARPVKSAWLHSTAMCAHGMPPRQAWPGLVRFARRPALLHLVRSRPPGEERAAPWRSGKGGGAAKQACHRILATVGAAWSWALWRRSTLPSKRSSTGCVSHSLARASAGAEPAWAPSGEQGPHDAGGAGRPDLAAAAGTWGRRRSVSHALDVLLPTRAGCCAGLPRGVACLRERVSSSVYTVSPP